MLKEGDKVPAGLLNTSFEGLPAGTSGKGGPSTMSLAELTPAGKTLVLFFYPKDSTPGCTREAQGFTASRRAIEKAGGVVVGVSRDSVKSHGSFRDKYGLDVTLLSDPDRLLHEGFGAWGEKSMYGKKVLGTIRSTFFVKDGKVVKAWPSVKVDAHIEQVLGALGGKSAPAPATAKKTAAAPAKTKTATKKSPTKKSPTKKSPTKKSATT